MREFPANFTESSAAGEPGLLVERIPGIAGDLDEAAAAADPSHSYLRTVWFAAAGGRDPATLVARRPNGQVAAALPTVKQGPVRAVPGCYWPYRSFPVAADLSVAELAVFLASREARRALGRVWRVGPLLESDPTGARLVEAAPLAGWTLLRRRIATSWVLDVGEVRSQGAWPRSSTLRKNRWFEKELAQRGELEWRFVTGAGWTAEAFDTLAEIERNSWLTAKTDASDSKFLAPHNRRFWEAAARDPAIAEMMWAAILHVGGVPAAFSFDVNCGRTKYCIANSYDRRFAKQSPGRILCYRNFEKLEERGTDHLDWGAGDPGYKKTLGAWPDRDIVDYLFVRGPILAALLRPLWRR